MKRLAIGVTRSVAHAAMNPFERRLMRNSAEQHKPIFIIGAPRSGTSLLYELMITKYYFAYISNAAHRFFKTPLAATRLFRSQIKNWQGDFSSRFGHIDGWGAPNEGGWVWQRWLDDGPWTDGSCVSENSVDALRRLASGISQSLDAPFLNKNVMHSNRLMLMDQVWPDALFIEVRRDTLDNARSILRAERQSGGPEKHHDDWWSVRPRLATQYAGRADTLRAIAQVEGVAQDIAQDIEVVGTDRLLSIDYSELCAEPRQTLQRIASFSADHGCYLRDRLDVPAAFETRPARLLSDEDETMLQSALAKLRSR